MKELEHFLSAQNNNYPIALQQVRSGAKGSHWMWYIFPQLAGVGQSELSKKFAIQDLQHAQRYLDHPLLGKRLLEISMAVLDGPATSAYALLGSPDDLKLRSCMTLFAQLPGTDPIFAAVLDRFFQSRQDPKTLQLLSQIAR